MATKREKSSAVAVRETDDGGLVLVARHKGHDVPLVTVPANVVRHHVEDVPGPEKGTDDDEAEGE